MGETRDIENLLAEKAAVASRLLSKSSCCLLSGSRQLS